MRRWSIRLFAVGCVLASAGVGAADQSLSRQPSGGSGLTNAPALARADGRIAVASHSRGAAGLVAEVSLFDEKSGDLLARVPLAGGESLAVNPKIAASADGFAAVWFEDDGSGARIRFAALDRNGQVTVPPSVVSDGAGSAFDPVIVRGAAEWGVFWFQMVDGGTAIHFASLSDKGQLLVGPRRLTEPTAWGHYPAAELESAGGGYGVAWHGRSGDRFSIRFRIFDRNGEPMSAESTLDEADGGAWYPSVARSDGGFAVAWHEMIGGELGISFRQVGFDGVPAGPPVRVAGTGAMPMFPALAASSAGWVLAWTDRGASTPQAGLRLLGTNPAASSDRFDRILGGAAGTRSEFPRPLPGSGGAWVAWTLLENGCESIGLEWLEVPGMEEGR